MPSISNQLADALSRRHQPGSAWRAPPALQGVAERVVLRRAGYYRTGADSRKAKWRCWGVLQGGQPGFARLVVRSLAGLAGPLMGGAARGKEHSNGMRPV